MGFDQDDSPIPIAAWTLKTAEEMDRVHCELMNRGIAIQRTHCVGTGVNGALSAVVFADHKPEQITRMLEGFEEAGVMRSHGVLVNGRPRYGAGTSPFAVE